MFNSSHALNIDEPGRLRENYVTSMMVTYVLCHVTGRSCGALMYDVSQTSLSTIVQRYRICTSRYCCAFLSVIRWSCAGSRNSVLVTLYMYDWYVYACCARNSLMLYYIDEELV